MFPTTDLSSLPPPLIEAASRALAPLSEHHEILATHATTLIRVFACSPFVAEFARREPRQLAILLNDPTTFETCMAETYTRKVTDALDAAVTEHDAQSAIRLLRNRELVRIAWRDLTGVADLDGILVELSALADALVMGSLAYLNRAMSSRFGEPRDEDGHSVALLPLAMGKLGGRELNFSSDIDLIFLYRSQGETRGGSRSLSNQEYFDRLGKKLIAFLHDTTADGFVYRVDMRLRPFGESGQLTTSFAALEHYYQVHGRDWERYALIKGRIIGRDAGDVEALEAITRPFIYRRYLDFGALDAVREMKGLITTEVAVHELTDDVKRGPGGIREIEFIGQMFQLIRGGREPRLRARGIIAILKVCGELGLLSAIEVEDLCNAYHFLRVTEHRLQQVHDQQTQTLPHTAEARARLTFGMGFESWAEFNAALTLHRSLVSRCFAALLNRGENSTASARSKSHNLWLDPSAPGSNPESLRRLGFVDPFLAQGVLDQLKEPSFLGRLSVNARSRLDRLMPTLVLECAGRPEGARTLRRLAELIRAIARRSVYLALLSEHPDALKRLVDLCQASPWIARELTATPLLLDELLDSRNLFSPPTHSQLKRSLDTAVATGEGDLERIMDILRVFKHQQVLRVAASDLMAPIPIPQISNHLTWIAEVLIDRARALAWQELVAKFGLPQRNENELAGFAIIAYGKLGGLELGYGSDLDLVFIHDGDDRSQLTDGGKPVAVEVFFTRLAQRLIHFLATRTPAGIAYELDVRLRPSGAAGMLVTSLGAFEDYQRNQAWTWEQQALVRARAVAGTLETCESFEKLRRSLLCQRRDLAELRRDILTMRERMRAELDRSNAASFDLKHGPGGITDIEFMVQYAVLGWAHEHQILSVYTDNLRLLDLIANLGLITREDSNTLREAYFAYRAAQHRCALQEIDGLVECDRFSSERAAVSDVWTRVLLLN